MVKIIRTRTGDPYMPYEDELIIKCDRCHDEVDRLFEIGLNDYPDQYCSPCIDKIAGITEVNIIE